MRRLDLKIIRASMLPFFLLLASAAFANSQLLPPEHEEIVLQVENMTRAACVVAVRNSLKRLEGIESVEIDYDAKEAIVIYSPTVIDTQAMLTATTDIGFPSAVKKSD